MLNDNTKYVVTFSDGSMMILDNPYEYYLLNGSSSFSFFKALFGLVVFSFIVCTLLYLFIKCFPG